MQGKTSNRLQVAGQPKGTRLLRANLLLPAQARLMIPPLQPECVMH